MNILNHKKRRNFKQLERISLDEVKFFHVFSQEVGNCGKSGLTYEDCGCFGDATATALIAKVGFPFLPSFGRCWPRALTSVLLSRILISVFGRIQRSSGRS